MIAEVKPGVVDFNPSYPGIDSIIPLLAGFDQTSFSHPERLIPRMNKLKPLKDSHYQDIESLKAMYFAAQQVLHEGLRVEPRQSMSDHV